MLQFAMSFLRVVGDGGLGMALLQQPGRPDEEQLSSVFWTQLGIALALISVAFIGAPFFVSGFDLADTVVNMLRAFSVSFLFSLMRSVPMISMERDVKFGWVGTIEFFGSAINYMTACAGAYLGFGAMALVLGLILETFSTMVMCFWVTRWFPRMVFVWARVRPILGIGFNLQAKQLVGMINDAVSPVLLGLGPGAAALGLVNFARTNGETPKELIALVRRVAFPYLSRLQDDAGTFVKEFHLAVSASAAPTFFFLMLFFTAGEPILRIVFDPKWVPALAPLLVFSAVLGVKFYTWIGDAALDAIGDARLSLRIATISVVLTWIATALTLYFSPTPFGFALGAVPQAPIAVTLMTLRLRAQGYKVRPIRVTMPSVLAAAATGVLGQLVFPVALLNNPWGLLAYTLATALVFLLFLAALDSGLRELLRARIRVFRGRAAAKS